MKKKLFEIADISSGLVVSRKKVGAGVTKKETYKQLNLRTFNKNGYLDLEEAEILESEEKLPIEYLTQEGDIVIRMTEPFTAIYITKEYENIVVSSNFSIIRNSKVNPEYLCYYLNSDFIRKELFSNLQGNLIKNISMVPLKQLDIPIIDDDKQAKYASLFRAETEKIKVLEQLIKQEEKRRKAIIEQLETRG